MPQRWSSRAVGRVLAGVLLAVSPPLLAGWSLAAGAARAPFADVALEDPDGRTWQLAALAGQPALVVVADRSASAKALEWGRAIGAARPERIALWTAPGKVATISVADLRAVPGFARGAARLLIEVMAGEQAGQGGPPLLLDWEGAVAGRIDARQGVASVRLYAADGALVHADSGEPSPDKVARLARAIDALFADAAPSATRAVAVTPTPAGESEPPP